MATEIKAPSPRFIPLVGDLYWWNTTIGDTASSEWQGDKIDLYRRSSGNCYSNQAEARKASYRQVAATHRGFIPKYGQKYYMYDLPAGTAFPVVWYQNHSDYLNYWVGNVHRSYDEAISWGTDAAPAFTLPKAGES